VDWSAGHVNAASFTAHRRAKIKNLNVNAERKEHRRGTVACGIEPPPRGGQPD
jgi:hypothetical protein